MGSGSGANSENWKSVEDDVLAVLAFGCIPCFRAVSRKGCSRFETIVWKKQLPILGGPFRNAGLFEYVIHPKCSVSFRFGLGLGIHPATQFGFWGGKLPAHLVHEGMRERLKKI